MDTVQGQLCQVAILRLSVSHETLSVDTFVGSFLYTL